MKRISIVALLAASLVLMLPSTADARQVIRARNSNTFSPSSVSVNRGERVVWNNVSSRRHTVTATSNNWNKNSSIQAGGHTGFTFNSNGTYRYRCNIHAGMTGRINVG
ncbi:MAG: plastocyanin/azurin family copper-binding protein [Actinomycetota bacterium]